MNFNLLDRETYPTGAYVFREGQVAGVAYIVQDGIVETVKTDGDKETVLSTIPKGGIFGEMALVDDAPRMASARMAEGGTLIVISRKLFEEKMAKSDPFVRALLRIFADTIRRLHSGG